MHYVAAHYDIVTEKHDLFFPSQCYYEAKEAKVKTIIICFFGLTPHPFSLSLLLMGVIRADGLIMKPSQITAATS
jgi:hypothetical protein